MAHINAMGQDWTNNADGWTLGGGTVLRYLTLISGNVSIAGSGSAVVTFPVSTSTLATLGLNETFSGTKTFSSGSIPLSNGTNNVVDFGNSGVAAPGASSAGIKLKLNGTLNAAMATSDFAFGIESNYLWANANVGFKWYKTATLEMILDTNGRLGIGGQTSPSYILSLDGQSARTIGMERDTTAATAGQNLTILSGGAFSGGTNLAAGDLVLSTGTSTGTAVGKIKFFMAMGGSSGGSDNAAVEQAGFTSGRFYIGAGSMTPTSLISLDGQFARRIGMERETTAATAGNALTLLGGGAVSGGTNLAGGDVILSPGISTGTGGGNVIFYAPTPGGSGTTDRTPAEVGRISATAFTAGVAGTAYSSNLNTANGGFGFHDDGTSTYQQLNIRPNSGKDGWLSWTENAVADRWNLGIKHADATLYLRTGNIGSPTDQFYFGSTGVFRPLGGYQDTAGNAGVSGTIDTTDYGSGNEVTGTFSNGIMISYYLACFVASTNINMSDKSLKKMEEVVAGDKILSIDDEGKQTEATVISNDKIQGNGIITINGVLKCAPTQHIKKGDKWVKVKTLKIGDIVSGIDGDILISSLEPGLSTEQFYDLTLDGPKPHAHFAEGFLVYDAQHGKDHQISGEWHVSGTTLKIDKGRIVGIKGDSWIAD